MSEINPKLVAAIRESRERRKKRKRESSVHITLSEAEREEWRALCVEHGMLEREMLMNAARAFKTLTKKVEIAEARLVLLEARVTALEGK